MRRKSIVLKLFIITTVLCMLLFSIHIFFQNALITRFYKDIKISMLEKEIKAMTNVLEGSYMDKEKLYTTLNNFSQKNEAAIALINKYGNPEYGLDMQYKSSLLKIIGEDDKEYNIYIDIFLKNLSIDKKTLTEGMEIEVTGELESYENKDVYIFPYQISIDGKEYDSSGLEPIEISDDQYNTIILEDIEGSNIITGNIEQNSKSVGSNYVQMVKIKGHISSLYIPDEKFYSSLYKEQTLYSNILSLIQNKKLRDIFKENELAFYELIDEGTGINNIIFVKPVDIKNHGQYLFFASTSLQPVNDAVAIIKNYNKYFLLLAVVMAAIAAYFYSKIISRPLIHMKNIAYKMANLDFSSECKIDSDDEIGDLANSLNTLSNNLSTSLKQLKEANEKLVDDIERERRQERIRKEFIANVSHELKTPLTVIEGVASGIRDGLYDSNDAHHINSLIEEVNHMNELIFEMLQLSKIEADGYTLNWEIFDISHVVLKVHSKLKKLAKDKNIQVILDLDETFVNGDRKKLEQVITNLYSNAVRYTNEGERILIDIKETHEKSLVTIENTGVNIPEDEIEEIWKPFYRIEKSRNRESGGTGLGLQIVKRILEHHESDFGVKNSDNSVVFYFSLNTHVDTKTI